MAMVAVRVCRGVAIGGPHMVVKEKLGDWDVPPSRGIYPCRSPSFPVLCTARGERPEPDSPMGRGLSRGVLPAASRWGRMRAGVSVPVGLVDVRVPQRRHVMSGHGMRLRVATALCSTRYKSRGVTRGDDRRAKTERYWAHPTWW